MGRGRSLRLSLRGYAFAAALVFRIYTLLVTLTQSGTTTQLHRRNTASSVFAWWDGQWYLRIAQHGYDPQFVQHSRIGQQIEAAFPPALASLIAGTHAVLGVPFTVAGLVWGFVALTLACLGLTELLALDYDARVARLSLAALLLWPPAMFLGMVYQDGITLAGIVWAFVFVRRNRTALAGLCLGVAVLSKLVAGAALLALLVEHFQVTRRPWRRPGRGTLALVAIPIVVGAGWLLYAGHRYSRLTAALDAEKAWGHGLSTPWHSLKVSYDFLIAQPSIGYQAVLALDFIAVALMVVALGYLARRRVRPAYLIYTATMLLVLTTNGRTASVARYALLVFPIFLAAALAIDSLVRRHAATIAAVVATAAAAIAGQVWLMLRFARYYWAG